MKLVQALRRSALERPDDPAFHFLANGEDETAAWSFGDLDARARAIAALLRPLGVGGRVLLVFPPGLDFLAGFLGCLYAGSVAVPVYPPQSGRGLPRLARIVLDARPGAILTTAALRQRLGTFAPELPALGTLPCWAVDEVDAGLAAEWRPPDLAAHDLALLQYTSGSTSSPKGVMVSHGNLLHNEEMIRRAFAQSRESVVVSWLPPYHDMGLIGSLLQSLFVGGRCVLMSPVAFLQKPQRWLRAISRYRGTTSGGPNFAYELCLRRTDEAERAELDLSSWSVAFNGAEPVRADTLERFAAAFAGCGFRPASFFPCYGLAEATLFVAGGTAGSAPREISIDPAELARNRVVELPAGRPGGQRQVSCGHAWNGQRVSIVDPESGRESAPGRVGEIRVEGPSVALGYWNRPGSAASEVFSDGSPRALRTGDLGFLAGGELYVTGRLKDLIILRGRNHYPQDVELTAGRAHPDLLPGGGAAFAVETGTEERLVIVHEVARHLRDDAAAIAGAVRQAVAEEHEVQAQEVVLIRQGGLPKTSSGKVQRGLCRELYLRNELPVVGRSALAAVDPAREIAVPTPETLAALAPEARREPLLAYLRERAAAVLGVPVAAVAAVAAGVPLTSLGLDSLASVELKAELEATFGVAIPLAELAGGAGLAALAERILSGLSGAGEEDDEGSIPRLVPLSPAERRARLPLTVGQRALWFLERLHPDSAAYVIAGAGRLAAGADPGLLHRALQALVDRHPALRTTFAEGADGPGQQVTDGVEVAFRRESAAGWSAEELRERLQAEAFRPFDLERGPLFRATLFATAPLSATATLFVTESSAAGGDILVLAIHHLIADLWSLGVLAHELGTIHDALADGATPESALAPLDLEPADYVRWQERALAAGWAERHWGYWRQRLAGAPFLDLPTDRPRPALPGQRGLSRSLRLDAVTTGALQALARRGGGTLFTTLLTGYQALLARYSGQDEFLVASPTAGRSVAPGARLTGLVGYFVNPIVLRADLTGEPTADEALERGHRIALDAFEHQDFPYPWLAERLQSGAERSAPLVRAAIALQKASSPGLEALAAFALGEGGARLRLGGLTLESVALESPATQFEVSLLAAELEGRIVLALQLDADIYDGATADRMLGHLGGLLRAIAATPESRLAELDILSVSERDQLLTWRRGSLTWSAPGTVHGLFEEQARQRPEAIALVAGERRLTYGELARRSGSLASSLRRLGVGPEIRVGLAAERSLELVVGILGILRAGGALVPLDPAHPPERLALLRDDSDLSVIVAQGGLAAKLAGGPPVLPLEDVEEGGWSEVEVPASALAYVIYTSGSTGRPKGVGVSHGNAVPMLLWSRSAFGLGEGTRVIQSLSYAFDFGLWEILTTIVSGATLHIPPVAETGDPQAFARRVVAEGIDTVHTTPSFFRAVAETGARLEGLRTLHLGGEALSRSLVERLATAVGPGCTLYNGYGPTEVTVNSLLFAIGRPSCLHGGERTPIGRPSADNAVYVMDRQGGAVPVGVAGELQVGGPGVARGYLGRAELTAERFVPDGFGGEPGGRLYQTGDLVRWLADGMVEFLGRVDDQVKIRGFRIEPGEVEAALRRHPRVREAVVVARELAGGMALVAYVVSEAVSEVGADELRDFLSGHLPAALVPSAFVRLTELPLTPTGKVYRRALPEPQLSERNGERELPRTPAEAVLAGIFEEVLGIAGVGRTDSFFQLGGHSLVATRVVSRLRDALGVELPLRALFETPTVAALAQRLVETGGPLLPPVERVERGGELPLSYAQERLWFLDQLAPGNPAYNLPGAARLRGRLQPAALAAALSEVVRRHEALRTRFVARAQVVAAAAGVPLPQVDLRDLPSEAREVEARRLRRDDAVRPFDLGQGPLPRAGLLRLGEEDWIFLLTQHHIASDGGSVGILIGELSTLYSAVVENRPSPLEEPRLQYGDYAVWQRRTLETVLSGELSWWREQLRGAPEVLELPTDHPRPAVASPAGGRERLAIAPELWSGLERLGREAGTTPFMTLLAAFSVLLSRYADQAELLVGSPVSGRSRRELEGMIGLFVNTLALRVSVEGEPSFLELLGRVRETTLTALAHQALPFERLVEELAPERSLDRNPLFQVLLAVQEKPPVPRLAGLTSQSLEPEGTTAKLDLSLEMAPEGAPAGESFGGWIEYRRDLYERATMQRFAGQFETLLAAVVADAGMAVSALPLLTRAEREQMLGWHRGPLTWAAPGTVHGLFEEQARQRPEAIALMAGERWLTYGELARRSGSLASSLRRLGVGPEIRVGLAAERSPELVIGILGILRAGGALVPLDPAHPPERLALLRDDSDLSVIVAQGELAAKLAGGPPVLCLEDVEESGWSEVEVPASALAYVIYTSGSTGRPKGVGVSHANAVPMLLWSRSTFGLGAGTRVLQSLSYAFDFGLWEILTTIVSGATLHIPPVAETGDPHAFARRVVAEGIDTMHTTPSFFRAVAETGARLEGLRTLHLGGEALSRSLVERLAAAVGAECTLYNGYGPTEVTVNSLLFAIGRPSCLHGGERTPIGRPSADNAVYVMDRQGGAVPVGVAGELQVGGPGVARGYLGRAELTAEKFVPDGFGGEPGGRLYRTGDLVRWLADGTVEFLGRVDEQVKIRGFRIEPGEVEAALRRHSGVREAVVVARELAGGMALVAYVVSEAVSEVGADELRDFLSGHLPAALVPSAFVRLGELPLTPTGKVDRRSLPEPQLSERNGERELPRTPAEAILAGIFEEVLGIAGVGRTDSFFQLGGHSLVATRVVSRLRDALGVELPLRALFETPTVAALAQRLVETGGPLLPPVERVERGGELPLSYAQERLWFLDQLAPGNPAYNLPGAARLRGRLQPAALAAALSEVVRRHEALRTRFVARAQVVAAAAGVPLPQVDLRDLPADAREIEARRLRRDEAGRPFDLGQGPLLRAGLLRLGEEDWIFLLTQHHIVSDGGSVGVLIGELSALYSAVVENRPSPLEEPPLQYGDYAVWQRRTLETVLSGELSWWREHLRGAPEVLELPTDHPRPAVARPAGGREPVAMAPELWSGLERLGREAGTTPFMTLLAAFSVLLSRYADQAELLVGSPVSGRSRGELEGMIGLFVNTLALRVSVEGEPSFLELLGRVRETTLTALAHQALPFERLVEELAPERSLDRNPLFQVLLAVQERPPAPRLAGLTSESLEPEGSTAKLDLSLEMTPEGAPAGESFGGWIEYRRDLYERATMQRFAGHFETLLAAVVADAGMAVSALPLLTRAEQEQMLGWHRGPLTWAAPGTVHGLFEEQARLRPEAIALVAGERWLTYGELARRSGSLASSLRRLGVGPEIRVGLAAERSPELVIGILGILRAGGALVPLDPAHPSERLALLRDDSGLSVIVAQSGLAAKLAGGPPVVQLEDVEESGWSEVEVPASALAYVIYTSGSTGRPKGVGVSHANAVPMLLWSRSAFGLGEGARVLQSLSYAFDFGLWEILTTLVSGATLHISPVAETGDPQAFASRVVAEGIDTVHTTPSFFRAVAETGARLEGLRTLHLGGEALSGSLVERLATAVGAECTLYNGYGPTEVTVNSLLFAIGRPGCLHGGARTPIGRPSADNAVYVVDRWGAAVPVGVAGELQVGGPGVARGYLGRAELTAEKFVPDAFGGEPGGRVYRTGDLVRWLADGTVEFLGRVDDQVKIRGFRIEPGEVEAALRRHSGVREAVVVARELAGSMALVAYVVTEVETGELRDFLRGHLPAALIPSAFVHLGELPLTPTGKVDRRGLPEPRLSAAADSLRPRSPVEELLAGIYAEVLGIEPAGVEESFFELGGHSLLATQVVARVQGLGFWVTVRDLFETPSVAAFAARLIAAGRGGEEPAQPPLRRVSRTGDLPLSSAQERLWFLDQLDPGSGTYNLPAALRLTGPLHLPALAMALTGLVSRHEALRTHFESRGGRPVQVLSREARVFPRLLDLTALPRQTRLHEVERLAAEESIRPFDLARGPLLRTLVVREDDGRHVALFTMHHIVSDGWSMEVLVRELGALYRSALAGTPPMLPELPYQYADFAVWQREHLASRAEVDLAYWREALAGLPPLDLPTDRPRPREIGSHGGGHTFHLPAGLSDTLAKRARKEGVTSFMILLASLTAQLSRYTGREDVAVGSPVANRTRAETEGLIGFFVNTLVLRTNCAGDPSVRELLGRVREACLGAFAHQDVPFDRVVEELAPDRDPSRTPLFQVVLAVQPAGWRALHLAGLEWASLPVAERTAKFDLTVTLAEGPDGITGHWGFRRDLFEAATAARMAGHFEVLLSALLTALLANPGGRLSELPLLREGERAQVLIDWPGRPSAYPRERTLDELFTAAAARRPDAVALSWDGGEMTYGELDRRSDLLARRLVARGTGPDARVGVLLPRSPELIVATIAILKAGGAYLPLDATYPQERLDLMLRDAGAALVVTDRDSGPALAGAEDLSLLLLDDGDEQAVDRVSRRPWPESLAYVMYTSGSTGAPKGVAVTHRAVARLVMGNDYARFAPDEVFLQLAPFAFDAATFEIWGALLHGARLALAPPEVPTPAELAALLARHRVTTLWLTAGLFHQVVEMHPEALRPLRQLLAGGDVLSADHVRRALLANPGLRLIDGYGPTESTTFACSHSMADPREVGITVPLGRPIANTWAFVLDAGSRPVPVGIPGELFLGGEGLARGYLGRPDLTAERFVPSPYGAAGERLYRTGDRVRWLPSGELDFLGRLDAQVKIRGHRIEPGEVEIVLARHPALSGAAVVVREDERGDRRLAAFVTLRDQTEIQGAEIEAAELRDFLRERLPEPLIPASFHALAALPLTPQGKVDRRALAALRPAEAVSLSEPARGPVAELLAGAWAEVLGVERVGGDDDFFALGGHSLLATRLMSRVRQLFGVELPLRALFEAPTPAALAARLEPALRRETIAGLPPLQPRRRDTAPPASFAQERLWLLSELARGNAFYNLPAAVRLRGELDAVALGRALREIERRHESLRTTFTAQGGKPVQIIAPAADWLLSRVDLSLLGARREPEMLRIAREEAERPFDLGRDRMLRAALLRLGTDDHVLLVTLHHIAADAWSVDVLGRELDALYGAFAAGLASPLAELPVQYADFAVWQRSWLRGERLQALLAHWTRTLDGFERLQLPLDRARPARSAHRGRSLSVTVAREDSEALLGLARREGVTLYMLLLSALSVLLASYSGQEDVAVGTPIANRVRIETEGLIGFFVNLLVMRCEVAGCERLRDLLARAREISLEAYAHQELPFERLVEELRAGAQAPLVEVTFSVQNAAAVQLALAGLASQSLDLELTRSRFDLAIDAWERPDGLELVWTYSTEVFDRSTIARMAENFRTLLGGLAAGCELPVRELPLIADGELAQLLADGGLPVPMPPSPPLWAHERFAAWAARSPRRPALELGDRRWTYGEIEAAANRLASRLTSLGAGPEQVVGLCVERSPEMVIGVLGILKSGAAYLPLDPESPAERLCALLEDAGAPWVLTRAELAERFAGSPARRVRFEEGTAGIAAAAPIPHVDPHVEVTAESLAYVIYTSGSTGRPKGVAVSHGSLAAFLRWAAEELLAVSARRLPVVTRLSFDANLLQWLAPLMRGDSVWLVPEADLRDAAALSRLLTGGGDVGFNGVPSLWSAVLAEIEKGRSEVDFGHLYLGGEGVSPELLARTRAVLPGLTIWNLYGPTEATSNATCGRLDGVAGPITVGRAIPGARVSVLDSDLRPVPWGAVGEICIGGLGLARGYLGRPELTAESFLPDPWSGKAGERLFRTGDLGRHRAGGIEVLGRRDRQVKIRGHRIELGEIEASLRRHPAVEDAVVTARGHAATDRQLAAYLVLAPEAAGKLAAEAAVERVAAWQESYDDLYDQALWRDGPEAEAEWIDATVERIAALRPERVLEIGCGTGPLLFRLAPLCRLYRASDLSRNALLFLRERFARLDPPLSQVALRQGAADDFASYGEERFDTVILNSVVQCFPSVEYLLDVLAGAVRHVSPGGAIFVGDVRGLPLPEPLDEELALDPAFFQALPERLPEITAVDIHPRRGRQEAFRYDVVLHVGGAEPRPVAELPRWAAYASQPLRGRIARRLVPELRAALRASLPDVMVPSTFTLLDALPLNANGKLDRRALPAPAPPEAGVGYVAPRNPTETALVEIWRDLLDLERIGIHDNFFALGGHSLLVTQVVSRVREQFLVDLPLAAVFETSTVAELAVVVVQRQAEEMDPEALAALLAEVGA